MRTITVSILCALLAVGIASASHDATLECRPDGPLAVSTLETPAGTFYVHDRQLVAETTLLGYGDGDSGGVWVYQETNGVPGLQTGGMNVPDRTTGVNLGGSDPCAHDNPDALIF